MKVIVGLGNPGIRYRNTKHNLGSLIVKEISKKLKLKLKLDLSIKASLAKIRINEEEILLAIPYAYMNLSGNVVKAILNKYSLAASEILIVCDDLELELGELRLKARGGSGGHNGLKSVIDNINTGDFNRLRVGIGRPGSKDPETISRFVLSGFKRSQKEKVNEVIQKAAQCCLSWFNEGPDKAMSEFN